VGVGPDVQNTTGRSTEDVQIIRTGERDVLASQINVVLRRTHRHGISVGVRCDGYGVTGGIVTDGRRSRRGNGRTIDLNVLSIQRVEVDDSMNDDVGLDTTITDELRRLGYVRQLTRFGQDARKTHDLSVGERISIVRFVSDSDILSDIVALHGDAMAEALSADSVAVQKGVPSPEAHRIGDISFDVVIER